ncbi:Uncharacterised protein [Corynebacterium ulcerans]|uniref:Uncharacterized protein n=1 Tax=Corynebacterium ulcerans TaxID=65058 RepID=A0ABD7MUK6_CORUL|nr:Uncharacterised protein [Corynebacterium ulcerans]SQG52473.1 Uncharacterised protein [Corynebacterium ulcerans]
MGQGDVLASSKGWDLNAIELRDDAAVFVLAPGGFEVAGGASWRVLRPKWAMSRSRSSWATSKLPREVGVAPSVWASSFAASQWDFFLGGGTRWRSNSEFSVLGRLIVRLFLRWVLGRKTSMIWTDIRIMLFSFLAVNQCKSRQCYLVEHSWPCPRVVVIQESCNHHAESVIEFFLQIAIWAVFPLANFEV